MRTGLLGAVARDDVWVEFVAVHRGTVAAPPFGGSGMAIAVDAPDPAVAEVDEQVHRGCRSPRVGRLDAVDAGVVAASPDDRDGQADAEPVQLRRVGLCTDQQQPLAA